MPSLTLISLCRSELGTYIIFPFSEEFLTFLAKQINCEQISSIFVWESISPALLKDIFTGYRILGWGGFSLHFKYFIPYSSCLHCFWEVGLTFSLCYSLGLSLTCVKFDYAIPRCNSFGIYLAWCSELPESVIWCLTLIGGKFSVLIQAWRSLNVTFHFSFGSPYNIPISCIFFVVVSQLNLKIWALKSLFLNWKCKFINIIQELECCSYLLSRRQFLYVMNMQFIILWFYFTLYMCLLKQSDCLAYKHIECALLPMGYVVYILQKN